MSTELTDEILEGDFDHRPDKLPQFLNVLTILTFVGSGLAVIGAIYNMSTIEMQRQQIEDLKALYNSSSMGAFENELVASMEVMLENVYLMQGSALVIALACIGGALLMRKLKKNGFYLYTIASLASIVIPISVLGFGLMGSFVLFSSIFTIAFVIMYGVNFKYLR